MAELDDKWKRLSELNRKDSAVPSKAQDPVETQPSESCSELDEWRVRRAGGHDSIVYYIGRGAGYVLMLGMFQTFLFGSRLPPNLHLIVVAILSCVIGTLGGSVYWLINERNFKLAEKLGRIPSETDKFGMFGKDLSKKTLIMIVGTIIVGYVLIIVALSFGK